MMPGNGGHETPNVLAGRERRGQAAEFTADARGEGSNRTVCLVTLLLLLAVLPYINTLQNGFVYDDNNEVLTNPYIRSFAHVGDIFSTRILAHLGARGATNYYRPIGIFGFLICYKLFGLLPYGFHLANLFLHAIIVCMIFGLTQRLFRRSVAGIRGRRHLRAAPHPHRIGGVGFRSDGP